MSTKLLFEDCRVAIVVAVSCHEGNVIGERKRAKPLFLVLRAEGPLREVIREVGGIGGAAAIANHENRPVMLIGIHKQIEKTRNFGVIERMERLIKVSSIFGKRHRAYNRERWGAVHRNAFLSGEILWIGIHRFLSDTGIFLEFGSNQ